MNQKKQKKPPYPVRKSTMTGRHRQVLFLTFILLIFGVILASHIKSIQRQTAGSELMSRYRQRQEQLERYETQYERLLQEQQVLSSRKEDAIARLLEREGQSELLDELSRVRALAGFTEVTGPGVRIILNDKPDYDLFLDSPDSIVHDGDIHHVLDLLRSQGAAALSVNGQRVVTATSIYCAGPTIICNRQRLTPPYIIEAIGNGETMAALVRSDPQLAIRQTIAISLVVEVEVFDQITLPAFAEANTPEPYINLLEVVNR